MQTYEQYATKHGLTFKAERIYERPDGNGEWAARHFKVRIGAGRKSMQLYFSQGSAHTEDPTLRDVLNCIGSDVADYENARGFEDWAGDLGYDTYSRKAEKVYKAVERQRNALLRLVGQEGIEELAFETNEDGEGE